MRETVEGIKERVQKAQRNYYGNVQTIEEMLFRERGYIFRKPLNEDVITLVSGGIDSSISVDMIINEFDSIVHPFFFRRGAKAQVHEERAFDFFVDFYKKRHPKNIVEPVKIELKIPSTEIKQYIPEAQTLTIGHPLRNAQMENRAVEYAVALNNKLDLDIKTIFAGYVGDDGTEPETGLLSLRAQTLSTCVQMGDWDWQVVSVLKEPTLENRPLYKADLIKYALENGIPLEKTRTCYSSDEIADGICMGCQRRLQAFKNVGINDLLPYKTRI